MYIFFVILMRKVKCNTLTELELGYRVCELGKHWALRPQKLLRLIRDWEVGRSGILYLTPTRYTVTTRMILHEGGQLFEPF